MGYDFKKKGLPTDNNIAVENSKVSNDYFWKTNKYTDQDVFGRTLDLTALINKPDGYLKGSLSDTEDVDYYEFNITEYRALSFAKDTYNKDITITLDHIPEGCDYEMVLYDFYPPVLSGRKDDIRHPGLPLNRPLPVLLRYNPGCPNSSSVW